MKQLIQKKQQKKHVLPIFNYRCCYISYTISNDYSNQFCKIIAFNKNSIGDEKSSFKHFGNLKFYAMNI